ncbi:MAG: restriction endonuclease subunit S [Burkholderiales bacterium]|jgi:type I restriction enzyme S subunit|nr:restriction endonuclease subunit S [Burkholderiales bacterium]
MLDVPKIDIRPDHLEIVQGILKKYVPLCEVWAFGSRAKWTAKEYSDLDLAIITDRPLSLDVSASLSDDFSESDLPWRVDVVDWATTSESFRKVIERDKIVVQEVKQSTGMAKDWQPIQLGEACLKIGSGATPRGGKEAYQGGDTALIRSQNIYNDRFSRDGIVYINDSQAHELRNVVVEKNDVLLNITGDSVARCCQVDPDVLPARVNQHVAIIRTKPEILDARFLRYVLISPSIQDHLLALASAGATRNALTKAMIESLSIRAPIIEEQRAIAHILGTLDDKIELNRKQNETLEAMARALFKAWFVDFEPVRAKMEGRWVRGQSLPGLPAHLFDIFPDKLVESELGEIPEGWEISALADFVDVVKGRSYKSEELAESTTALVTLKSFARGGGYRTDGLKSFTGKYKQEQIIEPGEVVVACTDVTQAAEIIGRAAIVRGTSRYQTLVASLDTMILRPRSERVTQAFLYHLGRSDSFVAHTYSHTTGTTVLHLGKEAIPTYRFVLPPQYLVRHFDVAASNVLMRIDSLEDESERLGAIRDTLLPKLISGELRVPSVMIEGII